MSNEHNESNQNPNNDQNAQRRRRRNRRRGPRSVRWFHDAIVGAEFSKGNVVAKFFISVDEKETPEIYFIPMHRETVTRPDGTFGFKPIYAGDIEKNGVPLSLLDLKGLWDSLVTMKARLVRMQEEHHGRPAEGKVPEISEEVVAEVKAEAKTMEAPKPKRSQQPAHPLTHRMSFPPGLVARPAPTQPTPPEVHPSLANALKGW